MLSPNAFDVFRMSLAHGTYLDAPPEERRTGVAIVNPVALRELGCTVDALDHCALDTAFNDIDNVPVVGVLNPVRLASMRYESPPAVFVTYRPEERPNRYWHRIFVRFENTVAAHQQREIVAGAWSAVAPDRPLEYEAMTERISSFYKDDQRLRTLGMGLTGIALVLVLLVLVALASYLTQQRHREIAIRKTLGATVPRLLLLLNREFATLTAVACVLGSAAGYVAIRTWLDRFATQISPGPLVFLLASLAAMSLAMLAVTVQSLSATRVDPAAVLRGE